MEVAGTALAIVGTIDLCLMYGTRMIDLCQTYRSAEEQFGERVLQVRSTWKRTSLQLDFIQSISGELDPELIAIQNETLSVLLSKLSVAISRLEALKISKKTRTKPKVKFAIGKDGLDRILQDSSNWQTRFDPSWILLLRLSSPVVDTQLQLKGLGQHETKASTLFRKLATDQSLDESERPHVSLSGIDLQGGQIAAVLYSTARHVQPTGSDKWFIADNVPCYSKAHERLVKKNLKSLAQKLACRDPGQFGILRCKGFAPSTERKSGVESSFELLFRVPDAISSPPYSLRSILAAPASHTLTQRITLAKQLARAVSYMHALGFVHKNIRPETVIGFDRPNESFATFFLVGFEQPRLADGQTIMRGDQEWHRNLYRHPSRQGLVLEESFIMQHDMYNLGVCLLEIGLWTSLVVYDSVDAAPRSNATLGVTSFEPEKDVPVDVKGRLVHLAQGRLPGLVGEVYSNVVLNCLTCMDEDNVDFGDESEFVDEDGVLVGARYIEKVLMRLDEIVV